MDFHHRDFVLTERHVQAAWYDAHIRPDDLRTVRAAAVRVIDPGTWNLEAGPDFLGATLEIGPERRRMVGDVEVHLRPSDWTAHGHAADPAYAHVVAHVTWYGGPREEGLPCGCVSIRLGERLCRRGDFSPAAIDVDAYPFAKLPLAPRPCELRFEGDVDGALELVRVHGERRLALKAARLAESLSCGSREQVFYEAAFTALGYKYNAFPFGSVAAALPWRDLPRNVEGAYTCLRTVAGMSVGSTVGWRLDHVRPANSPERRLLAAAALFAQGPQLLRRLESCALDVRRGQSEAAAILREGGNVGPGRAGAVIANVVVPFALAEGRLAAVPEWIWPEDVSSPVRLAAFRLFGRDHNPAMYSGNGLLIQGLLQIYREHCQTTHPECEGCGLARAIPFSNRRQSKED